MLCQDTVRPTAPRMVATTTTLGQVWGKHCKATPAARSAQAATATGTAACRTRRSQALVHLAPTTTMRAAAAWVRHSRTCEAAALLAAAQQQPCHPLLQDTRPATGTTPLTAATTLPVEEEDSEAAALLLLSGVVAVVVQALGAVAAAGVGALGASALAAARMRW